MGYIVESSRGKIGMVEFQDYFKDGRSLWGIYCLEGHLFGNVERFDSYDKTESAGRKYLQ
jgi:hypothetical protein